MLFANTGREPRSAVAAGPPEALAGAVWLDLLNPSEAERALAEQATGLRIPLAEELSEIERSSRLSTERGVLYMSAPLHMRDASDVPHASPLGFVLSDRMLLTVRFSEVPAFDQFAGSFGMQAASPCSSAAFLGLLEGIVDRLADVLEALGTELDTISRRVFRPETPGQTARTDIQLRATLRNIGRAGERLSNLRDSLLGMQRIVQYAAEAATPFMPAEQRSQLVTVRQDIVSLSDYDVQLSNKVQFLLDATLGFINIEQNNGIKILTVVSVVGVPPTLIASIYGMNFKWIPELQWDYGYFYGLALIVLSAVAPLFWFKRKGWI